MHISTISTALALVALSATTSATMIKIRTFNSIIPTVTTTLHTDDGDTHQYGWFTRGCKNKYDFVQEICMDTSKSRAHIYWTNQPGKKYCFRKTKDDTSTCATGPNGQRVTCTHMEFTSTACTW